jgi:hypothetical protein
MDNKQLDTVATVAKGAMEFYYSLLDGDQAKRAQLLERYYPAPQAPLMQWNGHTLAALADVQQYLASLPKTSHKVKSYDAQPLPGNTGGDSFVILIQGSVLYDGEHLREYHHRLIFGYVEKKLYVVNDYMRWTGEPQGH